MPVYLLQQAVWESEPQETYEQRKQKLTEELAAFEEIPKRYRNKILTFLLERGAGSISEMDYPLRIRFEAYLETRIAKVNRKSFTNAYDRIVQGLIKSQMKTLAGRQKYQWRYQNEICYLPYHPEEETAGAFAVTRQREVLVWDFSLNCSEQLKKQIFQILTQVLAQGSDANERRKRLLELQTLYAYGREAGIEDMECMELEQEEGFTAYAARFGKLAMSKAEHKRILNFGKKTLFLAGEKIHWHANVWYLERLKLPEERRNQSASLESISFMEISHQQNRDYAKQYMKYELGITSQAVSTIARRYLVIRKFLEALPINVCECRVEQIEKYIKEIKEKGLEAKSTNERIAGLWHFFKFLEVRGYIAKVPFHAEYYYQKVLPVHHDRSVEYDVYLEIIAKLVHFPERLRCMFLHLWCLGLRASEVCTLKGDAYDRQGNEPWIKVYQVKMKNYKRIPIPEGLYRIMRVYLKKQKIGPEDYIFQNTKGGACLYSTFRHQMLKCCEENEIAGGDYIFQSHDYRHTVATMFFDNTVSIQSIRDYLGHSYEEMTRRYIDYVPEKLARKNEEFFSKPGHDLAACLMKGNEDGKESDLL